MQRYWFMSFCDSARPKGTQFLGALIGRGVTLPDACKGAWREGLNPGGEVLGQPIPLALFDATPETYLGRLLTRAEAEALDGIWLRATETVEPGPRGAPQD